MQAVASNVSRRRLLGSVLTLGAGAAIGSTLSFPSVAVPLDAAGRPEPVRDELVRQLKEAVRGMNSARPGEAARGVAATLRLLAAHYQETGVDGQVKTRLRAAVTRDGRDAVLRWEMDAALLAAEARSFGVTVPLQREAFNLPARERALDGMLKSGGTPALLAAAAELTRLGPELERRGVISVAARQCGAAQGSAFGIEFVAAAVAATHPAVRAGFTGAYMGFKAGLWYVGC